MNDETKQENVNNESESAANEIPIEFIRNVYMNGLAALKTYFDQVEGQILNLNVHGPVLAYRVRDDANDGYACGFLLRELVAKFQSGNNPAQWMASFFFEMMKTKGGKELPKPPETEDEVKAIIDNILVPHCSKSVREEFPDEQVHIGLAWNEQHGPVLEAGFPSITEGNNVCASPLQLMLTHFQLNRDPAELLLQGLYNIRQEHGLE